MRKTNTMKQLLTLGTVILSISLTFGQTDQELAIEDAMNAKTLNDIELYQGKYEFQKLYWDQLNSSIIQTNWQLGTRNKLDRIALTTLSRNNKIIHIEAYKWEFNDDWDGEDLEAIWNYTTIDFKTTDEIDSTINFDHLAKLPNHFTFGYGCGATGAMPREGELMMQLVESGNMKKLDSWLHSVNPLLQAYAYLGFKLIESNGTNLETSTLEQMELVANSSLMIYYCSGCTVWEHRPVKEVISKREVRHFLKWYR